MECGKNAPPMHPNCHCATAPHYDSKSFYEWLDARQSGKTELGLNDWKQLKKETAPFNSDDIVDIVADIAGGDETKGSCTSVALAYIGQLIGFEVHDYRGGISRKFFANSYNLQAISQTKGMKTIKEKGACSLTVGNRLLRNAENGKMYYLAVGRHVAIVRKTASGKFQYLELQSKYVNGWKDFDDDTKVTLKNRFACSRKSDDGFSEDVDFMIDIAESNFDTDDFRRLLGYLNTNESNQKKGIYGTTK